MTQQKFIMQTVSAVAFQHLKRLRKALESTALSTLGTLRMNLTGNVVMRG